jgi:hypothetical protein
MAVRRYPLARRARCRSPNPAGTFKAPQRNGVPSASMRRRQPVVLSGWSGSRPERAPPLTTFTLGARSTSCLRRLPPMEYVCTQIYRPAPSLDYAQSLRSIPPHSRQHVWERILLKTGKDAQISPITYFAGGVLLKRINPLPPKEFGKQAGHEICKRTQIAGPNIVKSLVFEHSILDLIKLPERDTQTA